MNARDILKILPVIFPLLFFFSSPLKSQPVRDKILGNIEITGEFECALVRVGFNFPIRYKRHFPHEAGKEIRIQVEPILVNPDDRKALFKRESFSPRPDNPAWLSEVIYEGDMEGGFFLTLLFDEPALLKVDQGTDFRSLDIVVSAPDAAVPCPQKP